MSQGNQPAIWWQVDPTGSLPSWKGQHIVLIAIDSYSECGFAFPAYNASAKTVICGLTECLIRHHGIPHSTASDQETHNMANEVQPWVQSHGIHLSYHVPHHPTAAGLIEWWNGLVKTQVSLWNNMEFLQVLKHELQKSVATVASAAICKFSSGQILLVH